MLVFPHQDSNNGRDRAQSPQTLLVETQRKEMHLQLAHVGSPEFLDGLLYIIRRHVELAQHSARQLQAWLQGFWHHCCCAGLYTDSTCA